VGTDNLLSTVFWLPITNQFQYTRWIIRSYLVSTTFRFTSANQDQYHKDHLLLNQQPDSPAPTKFSSSVGIPTLDTLRLTCVNQVQYLSESF